MNKMAKGLFSITLMFTAVICIACSGITPMTVTASFMSLAGYNVNQPEDYRLDLPAGYTMYNPEDITSDRAAQEPEYMFLIAGKDAVKVDGPEINGSQYCVVDNKEIVKNELGFSVKVNSHVSYGITIDDFEDVIDLAEVCLNLDGEITKSSFIFTASPAGDGAAHNIKITAFVDDIAVETKDIGTIEVRTTREGAILTSIHKLSDNELIQLEAGELEEISFTDFAFVVDFGSPVTVDSSNNIVSVFGGTGTVRVFAQEGTKAECEANFFFPEENPANEVGINISKLGDVFVEIVPVEGQFPAHSQIVLDCGGYIERLFTQ